jgi:hypothetical protein
MAGVNWQVFIGGFCNVLGILDKPAPTLGGRALLTW